MASDGTHPAGIPLGLSYEELPEGSDLRRQYDAAGGVTIIAPAGEPPPALLRAAMRSGVVSAGVVCGACLLLGGLLLLRPIRANQMDSQLRVPALVALGVLCTAIFLLVWRVRYAAAAHALSRARRQTTVLHANSQQVLIETAGPGPDASRDVNVDQIVSVQVGAEPLPCLKLLLSDGSFVRLLPAYHEAELRWVAATLCRAIGRPTAERDAPPEAPPDANARFLS